MQLSSPQHQPSVSQSCQPARTGSKLYVVASYRAAFWMMWGKEWATSLDKRSLATNATLFKSQHLVSKKNSFKKAPLKFRVQLFCPCLHSAPIIYFFLFFFVLFMSSSLNYLVTKTYFTDKGKFIYTTHLRSKTIQSTAHGKHLRKNTHCAFNNSWTSIIKENKNE